MITVIIPAYNADKTIQQCLRSVLRQTGPFEIVLADDGSTDSTPQIAAEYVDCVKVLTLPHGGVSAARNEGLAAASGEWIVFLDADDALLPDAMKKLLPYMTDDVDAVCGTICRGREPRKKSNSPAICLEGHALTDFVLSDPTNYLTIHAWAFRRKQAMPRFDSDLSLGEDSDWVLRYLYAARKAVFVPMPIYWYTVSTDSTVHKWRADQNKDYLRMLEKIGRSAAGKEKNWPLFVLTTYLLILTHYTFHPSNPHGVAEKIETAKRLRDESPFKEAFANADLSSAGLGKRWVLLFARNHMFVPVCAAVILRQWHNRLRAER